MKKFVLSATIATLTALAIAHPVKAQTPPIDDYVVEALTLRTNLNREQQGFALEVVKQSPGLTTLFAEMFCAEVKNKRADFDAAKFVGSEVDRSTQGKSPIVRAAYFEIARFSMHYAVDQDCQGF
jgi:hypothetical protein